MDDRRLKIDTAAIITLTMISVAAIVIGTLTSIPETIMLGMNNGYSHIARAQMQNPTSSVSTTLKNQINTTAFLGAPTNKTIYIFSSKHEDVNETQLLIPADSFSPSEISVNKGDTVNIVFYNVEKPPKGDRHSFTIGPPYSIDKDLAPGQHATITFKATEDGVFQFFCKYHQPTMRGDLIVLP
ncbi:MAG: cupredoxin domain-containing protein [Nitrososphaeraceae archaeon]